REARPAARAASSRRAAPATARAPRRVCRCAALAARSRLALGEEAVPDAPDGEEVARPGGIFLEALAQPQDEVVHGAGRGEHVIAPDALEQILARDDLTGVLGEHLEDHRLLLGEFLRLAVPGAGAESAEVDFVAAEAQYRGGRGRGGAAVPVPAPQNRAHPQQELLQMKGLGEIVIAAGLQALYAIHGVAARGEKQYRRVVTLLAQRAAHAEAVDTRQHHIEHDEPAGLLAQPRERPLAIARGAHLVALRAQVLHDAGGEVRIVLQHQ